MKKRILILGGGISGERSISLKTAKAVEKSIKKKYNCRIVEPDENLTKNFNAILDAIDKEKSNNNVKGNLIKNSFITSTMGRSFKLKLEKSI